MLSGVLLDLAGVVYDGGKPIAGAAEAVDRLRADGLPLRFVSNTTRAPKRTLLARLRNLGLAVAAEEVFTPAQAACAWLHERGCSAHLLIHPDLEPDFRGLPEGERRAVVVGDAGGFFTYERLNAAFRELLAGADFLALARNRTFRDGDGVLSLDAGAFVAGLEFACRREAIVLGKPAPTFFHAALADMGCPPEAAVMVGDDAEADVAGALEAGLGSALLVRTGKYRPGDETRFMPRPTATLDDLAAAADWILRQSGQREVP